MQGFVARPRALVSGALVFAVLSGGGALCAKVIHSPDDAGVFHGCYDQVNGQLRLVDSSADCKNSELAVWWNQTGSAGATGATGAAGANGATGTAGADGAT